MSLRSKGALSLIVMQAACGNDVLHGPDGLGDPSGPGPSTEEAVAACADANARGQLEVNILFPTPDHDCRWTSEGNLAMEEAFFTARIEQPQTFELPDGAVICDLEFRFEEQRFRYDDHFLLHFDGVVIAASFDFAPELGTGDLLTYDWTKVRGMQCFEIEPPRDTTYCPAKDRGRSTCSFPPHDTPGRIQLDLQPSLVQEIMLRDTARTEHEMTFVTFGDNDPGRDCRHEPIELQLAIRYARTE